MRIFRILNLVLGQGVEENKIADVALLINHDDEVREFAYAKPDKASLDAAESEGWHVVSMKNDWQRIFSFEQSKQSE